MSKKAGDTLFLVAVVVLLLLVIGVFSAAFLFSRPAGATPIQAAQPAVVNTAVSWPAVEEVPTLTYEEGMATEYWATDAVVQTQEAAAVVYPTAAPTLAPISFKLFVVSDAIWVSPNDNGWTNYTLGLGITNLSTTQPRFQVEEASVRTKTGETYPAEVYLSDYTFVPMPVGMSVIPVCTHGACGDQFGNLDSYMKFRAPSTLEPIKAIISTSEGVVEINFITDVLDRRSLNQNLSVDGGVPFTISSDYVMMTIDSVSISDLPTGSYVNGQGVKVEFTVSNSDAAANHYSPVNFVYGVADGVFMNDSEFYSGTTNTVVEVGPLQTKTVEIELDIPGQWLSYSHIYLVGMKMKPDSQWEYDVTQPPMVIKLK